MSTNANIALTTQKLSLPDIPELFDTNYLDVLLPKPAVIPTAKSVEHDAPTNTLMDALKENANRTLTENNAPALKSTLSRTLDAFRALTEWTEKQEMTSKLSKAWAEDPNLTLRMIWQLRSIHDGKGEKEAFYRAWSWLYDNHPRTAIINLHLLYEPVCTPRKKKNNVATAAHGYWKDLLNILALATTGQLGDTEPKFLHNFTEKQKRDTSHYRHRSKPRAKRSATELTPEEERKKVPTKEHNSRQNELAQQQKLAKAEERFGFLELAVRQPKYRALYITVARLFAAQLITDISSLHRVVALEPSKDRHELMKQISLAGKWAPTLGGSHDRHTNISTAICQLLYHSRDQVPLVFPSALQSADLSPRDRDLILRSWYKRWIVVPLRKALELPEPHMSAREWNQINYNRIASVCMQKNNEHFLKHDPERFQKYLIEVESGKKTISGATLMPNEILAEVVRQSAVIAGDPNQKTKTPLLFEFKKQVAASRLRVAEAQWLSLLQRVEESGTIENSMAICDVSGSMGSLGSSASEPIMPALALSLVLSKVAKPPFNNAFISFSSTPEFIQIDPNASLNDNVQNMVKSAWQMNTDFRAVFMDLLLPLAKTHNIKQEDMVKRLFVFSDMQFDGALDQNPNFGSDAELQRLTLEYRELAKALEGEGKEAKAERLQKAEAKNKEVQERINVLEEENRRKFAQNWETTYDAIEKAYQEAGYEVPQIVFWDLSRHGSTVEVQADRKGVAMMNGFSQAMLKVFMGEQDEDDEEYDKLEEEVGKKQDEFTPLNVLKKSLMKKSYDGLVVVD